MSFAQRKPFSTLPATFKLFKRFPLEIREMIWAWNVFRYRVVEIRFYETRIKGRKEQRITSKTVVPALLHVCAESRAVGLKHYERFNPTGIFTGTYINWTCDYVYFVWSWEQFWKFRNVQRILEHDNRSVLLRMCRRLMIGRQAYMIRHEFLPLFQSIKDVAVLWSENWKTPALMTEDRSHAEIPGTFGSPMTLIEVDPNHSKEIAASLNEGRNLWTHVNSRLKHMDCLSLVIAERGPGRPLSKEEKLARKEREAQVHLKNQTPAKPTKLSFQNWRLVELRGEAKARGLESDGSKSELISRLRMDEDASYTLALAGYEKCIDDSSRKQDN